MVAVGERDAVDAVNEATLALTCLLLRFVELSNHQPPAVGVRENVHLQRLMHHGSVHAIIETGSVHARSCSCSSSCCLCVSCVSSFGRRHTQRIHEVF